jgi:CubicO group peptidase (beta-lactamase class C family)
MVAENPLDGVAARLEAELDSFVRLQHVAGAVAGVVLEDQLAWTAGCGFADLASGRRPDAGTLHMIGSVTKTFTGTAVMQLRDRGLLDLDDPVSRHLPELAERDAAGLSAVTIRRLLSHESGLMGDPPGSDWATGSFDDVAAALVRRDEIAASIPPNTQTKYSNLGYQLLGEVVTRVSGTPYTQYVKREILDPLGMSSTSFAPEDDLAARCAVGYGPATFSDDLTPASLLQDLAAPGGLWSTVEDLSRWLGLQFRAARGAPGEPGGAQVLRAATLAEMHAARYLSNATWTEAFGITWYSTRKGETVWVGHGGHVDGFMTYAGFLPDKKLGVIVLVNGVADPTDVALGLGEIALEVVRPSSVSPPAPAPREARDLLGIYFCERHGELVRVEWREGTLKLVYPDNPDPDPTLSQAGEPDVFLVHTGRDAGEAAVFLRAADGRVRGVRIAAVTYSRLAPVAE